jgi:transposase
MAARQRSKVMVKRKHQRHTREFKEQAIALANGSNKTLPAVAASLGVPTTTLAYWIEHPPRDRTVTTTATAPAGAAGDAQTSDPVALKLRLAEAREQIRVLEMEKEILKKATAFFARESR